MHSELNGYCFFITLEVEGSNVPFNISFYFELHWNPHQDQGFIEGGLKEKGFSLTYPLGVHEQKNDEREYVEEVESDGEMFGEDIELNVPKNYEAELCEDGLGGTYFVKDRKSGEKLFVFKPVDEEPGSVNNPKKNFKQIKDGVLPGEGAMREMIAYHLDRDQFAGVPKTKYAELENFDNNSEKKKGSLQLYINNDGNSCDFGSSLFSVDNVQRIAQFDIRTLNLDRNGENLLVRENDGEYELVPIDHSYILPTVFSNPWFEWMNWKQVKQITTSEVKKYIEGIDVEKDSLLLKKLGMKEESITIMKLSTLVLKRGTSVGWTLHQIATFLCSPISQTDKRSEFEKLVHQAKQTNSNDFWSTFTELLSKRIL